MTQASAFGQRLGQFLHLKNAPPSLLTRSLRGVELAVTETRDDNPVPGLSGSFTPEDAFVVSLKLHDFPDCELGERQVRDEGACPGGRNISVRSQARSALRDRQAVSLPVFLSAALGAGGPHGTIPRAARR